jgi:hypothetical protein
MLTAPIIVGAAIDHLPNGQLDGIAICATLLIASNAFFAVTATMRRPAVVRS